jgi:hypothetical protein
MGAISSISAPARVKTAGIGLGALNPLPESASAGAVKRLLAETQRGEFEPALRAISDNIERVHEAPLVDQLLTTLCQTAAAEVRIQAESEILSRLAERGLVMEFSYEQRKNLRDEIAASLATHLLTILRAGDPVSETYLRFLTAEVANEVVASNVAVFAAENRS